MPTNESSEPHKSRFDPADFPRGDDRPMEHLYKGLYRPYMAWAVQRWRTSDEVLEEAYNEAVLIFRRKAWEGSLDGYAGKQLNTILFSFAANLIRNRLKKEQQFQERFRPLDEDLSRMEEASEEMVLSAAKEGIFREGAEGKLAQLQKGFAQLTERCRQLLLMRIVHGLSMPEIAENMGMSGPDSAKTAKNKCLKRLKTLLGIA
jgi:RNA polymerase sigma factor (sigma-70 family)